MAVDRVRFTGEIVAVVLAETERQGVDAAAMVFVDLEPLPAVADPMAALDGDAPLLFPEAGTNLCLAGGDDHDPALFDGCSARVTLDLVNQRVAAVPLETNSALAIPDGDRLHLSVGSQNVFSHRNSISRSPASTASGSTPWSPTWAAASAPSSTSTRSSTSPPGWRSTSTARCGGTSPGERTSRG